MTVLSSKDNPKVRHWRKLAEDRRYRRAQRRALIEGPHLLQAAVRHGYTQGKGIGRVVSRQLPAIDSSP